MRARFNEVLLNNEQMKNIMLKIKIWWFWFRNTRLNYPISEQWSDKLQKLIDSGAIFTDIDEYTATLGDETLWIANCPYASFFRYKKESIGKRDSFLPNKRVAYFLTKLLYKSIAIQENQRLQQFEKTIN